MKNINKWIYPALFALSCNTHAQTTLIKNVNGYSINNGQLSTFDAIEIKDDKITRLYNQQQPHINTDMRVIDADGKTMLPGLIDAHGHVLGWGLNLMRTNLRGSLSEAEAVERTRQFRQQNPELAWVQGRGWNQVLWQSKTFPTAATLDKHFPDTPVWLRRVDGHAGWANSAAMKLAGISKDSKAPAGGEIIRNEDGEPSGVFIDNAMSLISQAIPALSITEQETVLKTAMTDLARLGLTSVHDAGVGSNTITAYKNLANKDEMPIRIYGMVAAGDSQFNELMAKGPYQHQSQKLDFSSVKISADGALGSRGAALIEDYSDLHGHKGLLLHSDKQLKSYMLTAMQAGFQVNTHAIGDHANKLVLDSYEALIKQTNTKTLRHRVEHAQILRLEDIPRFAKLGVIASMQATHATSDKNMAEDRVGPDRIKGAYAWQKLLKANAVIAAGSDFPVESANPFYGLHASVTRQDHDNQPNKGWYADESMSISQALTSFTTAAAFSAHQEHQIGGLAEGMKADFIFIDRDIVKDDPSEIWQAEVLQTWVDGEVIFDIENNQR
ncbi:amidohydrolase [Shewanella kaireitica]|uniref:amidohydrolase n=1 Tax=Shewanella kaireitica TaxID=212021 RepID=UPI00200FBC61|nr:amidohydrolase [Shewanella kaireitica]MCL1092550.1 amidohydrolase [Shewanella kaireitica]